MSNVQDPFWCDVTDEQGCLLHAHDCDQRNCFVVQEKKQETNTASKGNMPDNYRCTITCAFCGKRRHYKDECYHKQGLSAKLKSENSSGKGSGKGSADQDSVRPSSMAMAKAKVARAKVDKGALTARRTRTRTRTSLEETPILHQGKTLSPLWATKPGTYDPFPDAGPTRTRD